MNIATFIPEVVNYWLYEHWALHGDPRVAHLPLMNSALPILTILFSYAAFVLYLGPRWMAKREPFQLKRTLLVYNVTMVLMNGLFFYFLIEDPGHTVHRLLDTKFPDFNKLRIDDGSPAARREYITIIKCYFYVLSKIVDLLDTVFFVLRKKQAQVTGKNYFIYLKN